MEVYSTDRPRAMPELSPRADTDSISPAPSQFKAATPSIKDRKAKVLASIDFRSEYAALGVEFTATNPSPKGWLECRAKGREDRNPSANVNLETGDYKSFGDGSEHLTFFDFALRYGSFSDFMAVLEHYEAKVGTSPPRAARKAANPVPKRIGHATFEGAIEAALRSKKMIKLGARYEGIYWTYHNADGTECLRVVRFTTDEGKTFRPFYRDPEGGWFAMDPPGRLPLYGLAELGGPERLVFLEGEKCTTLGRGIGLKSTTTCHGADSPHKSDLTPASGQDVAIILDAGPAGEKYGENLIKSLLALEVPPKSIKVVRLPDLEDGEDIEQWLERAPDSWDDERCRSEIERMVSLAPEMIPPREDRPEEPRTTVGPLPEFANFHAEYYTDEEGHRQMRPIPKDMHEIVADLQKLLPGWPKRVGSQLFVMGKDHQPIFLDSSTKLFARVDSLARVAWMKGTRFIPQERVYEHLRMNAEQFDCIELIPHTPPIPNVYYMHRDLPKPTGKLDELVDMFCPATPVDRRLIKAMIMTPSWGGPPASRPAFLVTSQDGDPLQGRGVGKSKLCGIVSDGLYGGYLDVQPNEEIGGAKTRFLSAEGMFLRIGRVDNVKTHKFSWADFEGMITAEVISGKLLYKGEGRKPNLITWIVTINGATLSSDLAGRVVVVKLARPPRYDHLWEKKVREFARQHRWEILAECSELLSMPVPDDFRAATRWADWEAQVLSKVGITTECQRVLVERQGDVNDDDSDRDILIDAIRTNIERLGHDPDTAMLKIPSGLMARWVSEATQEHYKVNKASAYVNGFGIPEITKNRTGFRGFIWIGVNTTEKNPTTLVDTPDRSKSQYHGNGQYSY